MNTNLHRSRTGRTRAFSLIELMIAIVILGFGMAVAATMFPVGWTRARVLAENDARLAMVDNALAQFNLSATVDGFGSDAATFAGDLVVIGPPLVSPERVVARSDTRVHALNMENRLVTGELLPEVLPQEDRLDRLQFLLPVDDLPAALVLNSFVTPRVRFDERWYPPLRTRLGDPDDLTDPASDRAWEDTLDSRHHAWAVLHRARTLIGSEATGDPAVDSQVTEPDAADLTKSRAFDLYLVTLRRGRSTLRFPQQDTAVERTPDFLSRESIVQPKAKGPEFDTVLPTAWRVQVFFDGEKMNLRRDANGVSTEIQVPPPDAEGSYPDFVVDMFPEGAYMVDELNGQVFKVVARRLVSGSGSNGDTAYLTLDREVVIEEIDDGEFRGGDPPLPPPAVESDEANRTMWVFPPAAETQRGDANAPILTGPNPVIGIDVRTVHVAPRS